MTAFLFWKYDLIILKNIRLISEIRGLKSYQLISFAFADISRSRLRFEE